MRRWSGRIRGEAGRPGVGVAHVVLETDRMAESAAFVRRIGMRPLFESADVGVYELRGGTHLLLLRKDKRPRDLPLSI